MFFRMAIVLSVLMTTAPAAQSPTDDAAVRAVVARYVNARELRDAAAIEALFTRDADQLTTSGEWRRGRDAIVPGTLESSRRNPGTRQIRIDTIRFLTTDVAIVDGPYDISVAGATPRPMRTTIVVKREADAWRIAAIRNMVPTR
jgi:uncharacterized protein (TIGR02246 family)